LSRLNFILSFGFKYCGYIFVLYKYQVISKHIRFICYKHSQSLETTNVV